MHFILISYLSLKQWDKTKIIEHFYVEFIVKSICRNTSYKISSEKKAWKWKVLINDWIVSSDKLLFTWDIDALKDLQTLSILFVWIKDWTGSTKWREWFTK